MPPYTEHGYSPKVPVRSNAQAGRAVLGRTVRLHLHDDGLLSGPDKTALILPARFN